MTKHKPIAALVLCVVFCCALNLDVEGRAQQGKAEPAAKDAESRELLEQTRRNVLAGIYELPNFVVEQLVRRYDRWEPSTDWQLQDTFEVEITYQANKGEHFSLQRVNGTATRQTYESLGGSTSTGEFGSALVALFLPRSQAQFKEVQRKTYHGRPTVVYDFNVLKENSASTVDDKSSKKRVVCGYSGRVWIDTENKAVLRMELSYSNLPVELDISMSRSVVEYDWVTVGDQRYLMPATGEVMLGYNRNRYFARNLIKFHDYHKFESKMKVLDQ